MIEAVDKWQRNSVSWGVNRLLGHVLMCRREMNS